MAIINCPECGREVSDEAKFCIYCGFQIEKEIRNGKMSMCFLSLGIGVISWLLALSINAGLFLIIPLIGFAIGLKIAFDNQRFLSYISFFVNSAGILLTIFSL